MIQVINKCLKKKTRSHDKYKSNDNDYVEMGLTNTNLQKIGQLTHFSKNETTFLVENDRNKIKIINIIN